MSKTLKILSRPKGNAEEYGRWSVNPYIGCSHGCLYCYLKKGPSGAYLGQDSPVLKKGVVNEEHAFHLAMTEIYANHEEIIRDGGLFMTFTSDPCAEKTRDIFFRIAIESARELKIPVTILTKSADFVNFLRYIYIASDLLDRHKMVKQRLLDRRMMVKRRLSFGWTLTGHNELEPNAHSNEMRLQEMTRVYRDGFKVWASIEPVIDFPSALNMVYQAVNAGCQHFKIGLLTNNTRLVRKDFAFGEHKFKAYDVRDCLHFVEDVMCLTSGRATVYWKQSVRDLFDGDGHIILDQWPHSVDKNWNMFSKEG